MPSSHPPSCPHKNQPGRSLPRSFASPSFSFPTPKSRRVGAKTTHSSQQAAPEDALQRQTNHGELRPDDRTTGRPSEASADSPAPALAPPRKEAGSSKTNRGPPIGGAEPPAIRRAGISPEHSQKSNSPGSLGTRLASSSLGEEAWSQRQPFFFAPRSLPQRPSRGRPGASLLPGSGDRSPACWGRPQGPSRFSPPCPPLRCL